MSSSQMRFGMNGPVSLDVPAVLAIADIAGVNVTPRVLQHVLLLANEKLQRFYRKGDIVDGQ